MKLKCLQNNTAEELAKIKSDIVLSGGSTAEVGNKISLNSAQEKGGVFRLIRKD